MPQTDSDPSFPSLPERAVSEPGLINRAFRSRPRAELAEFQIAA